MCEPPPAKAAPGLKSGAFWRWSKTFARLCSLSWSITLQYRGETVLWLTAITATPLVSLAIWFTVASGGRGTLTGRDVLTYYILIMLVRTITSSWRGYFLSQQILNGEVARYLLRPPAIYWEFITDNLTSKAFQLLIPLPLFLAAASVYPAWFAPALYELPHLLLFFISLMLAYLISFTFDLSLGLLAFWLEDVRELMSYRFLLTQVTSGVIIPFALMPPWLHAAFSLLPFRAMLSAPVELLLGQVTGPAAVSLLATQAAWGAALILLARRLYTAGLRRYAVPGQ